VVMVLVMAGWVAYTHRGPVSPVSISELPRSNAIEQQAPFAPEKPAANSTSKPQTAPIATQEKKLPGPRRRGLGSGATSITSLKM
jgi:hypothetical protein